MLYPEAIPPNCAQPLSGPHTLLSWRQTSYLPVGCDYGCLWFMRREQGAQPVEEHGPLLLEACAVLASFHNLKLAFHFTDLRLPEENFYILYSSMVNGFRFIQAYPLVKSKRL